MLRCEALVQTEVQDDDSVRNNISGNLLHVQSIDRTNLLFVLTDATTSGVGADPKLHPLQHPWDHKSGDKSEGP
jgi:hypothetical protein